MDKSMIRSTPEWKALNQIWTTCSQEQRKLLETEFRFLTEFIRANTAPRFIEPVTDGFAYLQGLSSGAQSLIIEKIKVGEPNIYHSIMSVMDRKGEQDKNSIQRYYYEKYGEKRPYIKENWSLICEIFDFCWNKRMLKSRK